jgi:dihydrofolate synthase/folylpolyglutamate synthase
VAGTNGKGSTIATLRAILEAAGKRVHVYTSPHLVRFAERGRVAGRILSDDELTALLEEAEAANGDQPITFFEITTVAAFMAFAREPADFCILETGLGGRLDASNVVDNPAMTILTPIGLDHQQFLGDTLAAIAGEKAGILKSGVPCVVAAQDREAMRVIADRAVELNAPLIVEGRDFHVEQGEQDQMVFLGSHVTWSLPPPSLPGEFQRHNAGFALAALERIYPELPLDAVVVGLANVEWPARLQRLRSGPLVDLLPQGWELWLDGSHNPHGAQAVARYLDTWSDRPTVAIMGMLGTKDLDGVLAHLAPRFQALRGVTIEGEHNALSGQDIATHAAASGLAHAVAVESVEAGIRDYVTSDLPPSRILICGSLYLAGTVLKENG